MPGTETAVTHDREALAPPCSRYHASVGQPQAPDPRALVRLGQAVALAGSLVCAVGCVRWEAEVPALSFDLENTGVKMLRPAETVRVCRTRLPWSSSLESASAMNQAMRSLQARDAEANALTNVTVEARGFSLGVLEHVCVTMRADVVRTISVVRLPAPEGHHGAH